MSLLICASGYGQIYEVSPDSVSTQNELQPESQGNYAVLHIYRSASMVGAAVSFDLRLDDEEIFRAKNKSKTTVEITREGMMTLSAKTETKTEVPIDIKFGREYYIRCKLKMGAMVGRPVIEIVDSDTGKAEFDKITVKEKKK